MSTFQSFKHEIVTAAALSKDALHIYVGLAVFLVTSMFAKKGMRSVLPLVAVLLVAVAGELLDLRDEMHRARRWKFWASVHDFVNTAFWPLLLWLLARYTRVMK